MKRTILIILSIAGILISSYLAYSKLTEVAPICGYYNGCDLVQNSRYSTLLGIPIGIWGMLFYTFLLVLFYVKPSKYVVMATKLWILWGAVFSTFLTGLEAFVIHAFCLWCLGHYTDILIITGIYIFLKPDESSLQSKEKNKQ